MKQLFQEQDTKQRQLFKEINDRQQIHMRQTFAAVITEHVQPLGIAIEAERAEVHENFIGLGDEFRVFASSSGSRCSSRRCS